MPARPVVASLAAMLLTLGCGANDSVEQTGPGISRPTGPEEVVVQVTTAGGFLPAEAAIAGVPTRTVLGDGTVITQAAVPAIYPGPAIVPLQAATADARAVDRLVRRAAELGLLRGPLDFGRPPVADALETTVTLTAGGETHTHTAYALGMTDVAGTTSRLSEQELANRRALKEFIAATDQLPPGNRAWRPSAVAVYGLGPYRPEPELPQRPVTWPLDQEPATTGVPYPCTLFRGEDARILLDALAGANARTPWVVEGSVRSLAFRPVVPGQPGCPNE
ncbi:MAG: hypothetical protein M3203_05455 [Actinomycetota bacterium]|nr:hypothetical protein [Actinomycetota bacterium]